MRAAAGEDQEDIRPGGGEEEAPGRELRHAAVHVEGGRGGGVDLGQGTRCQVERLWQGPLQRPDVTHKTGTNTVCIICIIYV